MLSHKLSGKNAQSLISAILGIHGKEITASHNVRLFSNDTPFKLSKALIVTKLSRLEFEQHRHGTLSPNELEKKIRDRGTDYDVMLNLHTVHKDFEQRIAHCFTKFGVEVKLVNR